MRCQHVYSVVIFSHRFLDSDCINFKTFAFLAVYLSEHHYTTQTSKFNNFFKSFLHDVKQCLNRVLGHENRLRTRDGRCVHIILFCTSSIFKSCIRPKCCTKWKCLYKWMKLHDYIQLNRQINSIHYQARRHRRGGGGGRGQLPLPWFCFLCLSAQRSVMHVDDVPLPHYVNFATNLFSGREKTCLSPPPPPPPSLFLAWRRSIDVFCHPLPNTLAPPL